MGLLDASIVVQQSITLSELCKELCTLHDNELRAMILELDATICLDCFTGPLVKALNEAMDEPVYKEEE